MDARQPQQIVSLGLDASYWRWRPKLRHAHEVLWVCGWFAGGSMALACGHLGSGFAAVICGVVFSVLNFGRIPVARWRSSRQWPRVNGR